MTQMEIATIFLLHSLSTFGVDNASKIGFVLPRSIFNADQHENFRSGKYSAEAEVMKYWDLREVHPLFNVPACVAFLEKKKYRTAKSAIPVEEFEGRLPGIDLDWKEAEKHLKVKEAILRLIHLGDHSALSTQKSRSKLGTQRPYNKLFKQGATIVPRNFYFIKLEREEARIDAQKIYFVQTDEDQAKESKPPYDKIRCRGQIEGRFIGYAALARHVLPFMFLSPAVVALPVIEGQNGYFEIVPATKLNANGYRYAGQWFSKAEQIWNDKRGDKAERDNLYEWLDYRKKLSSQPFKSKHMVLYNAAGTHIAAAYFEANQLDSWFVAEHKVYWYSCKSAEEGIISPLFLIAQFRII